MSHIWNSPKDTSDYETTGYGRSFINEIARLIYNEIFFTEIEEGDMLTFDLAEAEEIGGYERALKAAYSVVHQIRQQEQRKLLPKAFE